MSQVLLVLPPVRLADRGRSGPLALAAPLLDRALRLARWAERSAGSTRWGSCWRPISVGRGRVGLTDEEDPEYRPRGPAQAWGVAVDTGLLCWRSRRARRRPPGPASPAGRGRCAGRRTSGLVGGDPHEVLEIWLAAAEYALAAGGLAGLREPSGSAGRRDQSVLERVGLGPGGGSGVLDTALANLYALMAMEGGDRRGGRPGGGGRGGRRVRTAAVLPLRWSSPMRWNQPSDAVLEEVTEVILRLDDHFRLLAPTGPARLPAGGFRADRGGGRGRVRRGVAGGELDGLDDLDPEEISRYGLVRLTPLGVHGCASGSPTPGARAPVGDLATGPAGDLLDAFVPVPGSRGPARGGVVGSPTASR